MGHEYKESINRFLVIGTTVGEPRQKKKLLFNNQVMSGIYSVSWNIKYFEQYINKAVLRFFFLLGICMKYMN